MIKNPKSQISPGSAGKMTRGTAAESLFQIPFPLFPFSMNFRCHQPPFCSAAYTREL
jgi:hypothetical protein